MFSDVLDIELRGTYKKFNDYSLQIDKNDIWDTKKTSTMIFVKDL